MDFLSAADASIENVSAFTYQGYDFSNKGEKCLTDLRVSLQGAHRPIGEDEDASQASGVMRQVHTNLRSTSNNSNPLKWAKLESY